MDALKMLKFIKASLMSGWPAPFLIFFVLICAVVLSSSPGLADKTKAPDFQAIDLGGNNISLSDFQGAPVLLHITNIENPLCRECENALQNQTRQISHLSNCNKIV